MNDDDLKPLEAKLHSWQPRRPSLKFKLRMAIVSGTLFPQVGRVAGVLIPAAACVMLAVLNLNSASVYNGQGRPSEITLALSNQNYAPYWADGGKKGENCPPGQIFKWTNAGTSPSSMRFKLFETN